MGTLHWDDGIGTAVAWWRRVTPGNIGNDLSCRSSSSSRELQFAQGRTKVPELKANLSAHEDDPKPTAAHHPRDWMVSARVTWVCHVKSAPWPWPSGYRRKINWRCGKTSGTRSPDCSYMSPAWRHKRRLVRSVTVDYKAVLLNNRRISVLLFTIHPSRCEKLSARPPQPGILGWQHTPTDQFRTPLVRPCTLCLRPRQ